MAALVLYQPPLDALLDFAEYGGIVAKVPRFEKKDATTTHDPMLVRRLIWRFRHPYAIESLWQRYYETLMKEINERFLKPQGLDIHTMRDEVLQDGTLQR
jgi:hypothetical protein